MSAVISAGPAVHKHQYSSSHAVTDINLDNVCKKGNTLLWDLVQDEDAVRLQTHLSIFSLKTYLNVCSGALATNKQEKAQWLPGASLVSFFLITWDEG